jgi:hypothetical protein
MRAQPTTTGSPPQQPAADRWAVWFAALLAAFLAIRATTTLLAGASFELPGDGWRSVWQLIVVAVLAGGLVARQLLRPAVTLVAIVYLGASAVELVTPDALFGAIPVDMRDRIVHPLVGVLGLAAAVAGTRRAVVHPA